MLQIVRTVSDLRALVAERRKAGQRIAMVPTMGALHEGHLTLVDAGLAAADEVVVSLFVNPTQFAPGEDLDRYPRDEEGDRAKLETRGATILWAPVPTEMYPDGFATSVSVGGPSEGLETEHRPHFFGGVATVVTKLLLQALPDVAIFGEKDYQQLQVIRRLVTDLNIPVEVMGGPTVREADGLAMSSRNAYLSADERAAAPALREALKRAGRAVLEGSSPPQAEAAGAEHLTASGFHKVDYIAIRHADSLAVVTAHDIASGVPLRVLGAAHLGKTRLIDNLDPRSET